MAGVTMIGQKPRELRRYYISVVALFAFIGLSLYTIVEMRRGIFLPLDEYFKVGAPSAILYFNPIHLLLLLVGGIGAWLAYRSMTKYEIVLRGRGVDLGLSAKLLGIGITVFLIVDLYTYRVVPASRIAAVGKTSVGHAIPLDILPWWLQPLGTGVDYLLLVWHATVLGMLIGALFLTFLAGFLKSKMRGTGFKSNVFGAALATSTPFCSCCAAPIGCTMYRGGASLGPTLAFVVSAPLLNVVTLSLATILLPIEFALARIIGGLIVAIFGTYAVTKISVKMGGGKVEKEPSRLVGLMSRVVNRYSKLFQLEKHLEEKIIDSPTMLVSSWLSMAWRLTRLMIPVLLVGATVTAAIFMAAPPFRNDVVGVIVAAAFGTILMVPTWTELPIAQQFISAGLTGPAAALLIALPAVSLPCLMILGGGINNQRVGILLGLLVFTTATLAGLIFLML